MTVGPTLKPRPRPSSSPPGARGISLLWLAWLAALPIFACGANAPATGEQPAAGSGASAHSVPTGEVSRPVVLHTLSQDETAKIARLLPAMVRLPGRQIPENRREAGDAHNITLFEAFDAKNTIVGYARPMSGPVTDAETCPCSPLALTLVFDASLRLLDIVAPTPLSKWGHEPMTEAEHRQLVGLADRPPTELIQVHQPEELIELESRATRHAFAAQVVARAALSTHRVATWTQQTRDIIKQAPTDAQMQQLNKLMRQEGTLGHAATAQKLADLLPTITSPDVQRQAFHLMANRYVVATMEGAKAAPQVESAMVGDNLIFPQAAQDQARWCVELAMNDLRMPLVGRCLYALKGRQLAPVHRAILAGSERFDAGDYAAALPALQEATGTMRVDYRTNKLFLRLAQAAMHTGQRPLACGTAELLYPDNAKMPGVPELLAQCSTEGGTPANFLANLQAQARAALVRTQRPADGPAAQPLDLTTLDGAPARISLALPHHITVVMFFATWCSHCQSEMPRVSDFARTCQQVPELQGKVQIIGVRTAAHMEREPLDNFLARMTPAFPIYTDTPDNQGLRGFAKMVNIAEGLPTLGVLDGDGKVRYLLEPGDHRDVASELRWAVESLL